MDKKIIRKVCTTLFSSLSILLAASAHAQETNVTIDMENVRMKQVMAEIEKQTSYLFAGNAEIDLDIIVTVQVKDRPLTEALDQMVEGTGITYRKSDSNIILAKKEVRPPLQVSGRVTPIRSPSARSRSPD